MLQLRNGTLTNLPAAVARPGYDRARASVGIVHIGVGGFHRAHQAVYLDDLMARGEAMQWGLCGIGLLPGDTKMRDAMHAQDCLYTMMIKHPDGHYTARVIGSMLDYKFLPDDPEAVLELMVAPSTRIVSLTITEGGYNFHHVTGEFDFANTGVACDLEENAVPGTVFGVVVEALRRRRARGIAPFTVLSCDNVQGNGDVARRSFTAFARRKDASLGEWIAQNVAFPNDMVDRITPVTSDADRAQLAERFGVQDAWPVVCEPFTQWVVEDHFPQGRPPFERVGVQLVHDVLPYELMKLRLLNAGHQAICYFGVLAGYRYAHEVMANQFWPDLLMGYWRDEAIPTLRPVPGVDLIAYCKTLVERFGNPEVKDTLARLCAETSDRIPKFLLPVVREQLATGTASIRRSAAIVASWARYAEGTDESGNPIIVVDPLKASLMQAAARNRTNPTAFIENRAVFADLVDEPRFVQPYTEALALLHSAGAIETMRRFL